MNLTREKHDVPAVVLGMSVNGLGVVRSLAREGIKVYAVDTRDDIAAMHTNYAECLLCPDVLKKPIQLKLFLLDLSARIGTSPVLFVTSDEYNEFLSRNRADLMDRFKFVIPPADLMERLFSKKAQYELAVEHNVAVPNTFLLEDIYELDKIVQKLEYPVIIKAENTCGWRMRFGDIKAIVVNNANELKEKYIKITKDKDISVLIQEIIQGEDSRHYKICAYLNRNSQPLLIFTLQKIRQYPSYFGTTSSVVSIWEPEVAEVGVNFMKAIGYQGVGSIEFKKDLRDNKFKMIKINPRFWAQNSLAAACGQNFALTAYLDALNMEVKPKATFKEGIKWIAFDADCASFYGYHKEGKITLWEWLFSILKGKKVWACWAVDDPVPFLYATKCGWVLIKKLIKRIFRAE